MSWFWLSALWDWYSTEAVVNSVISYPHAALVNPVAAGIGAALLIWAALRQAGIAARRHHAQTEADRQRRITESFSKAVEQLASEKIEARLGGIYTLERISRESPPEYWTVMEILTAFARERGRWQEPDAATSQRWALYYYRRRHVLSEEPHEHTLETDIGAVLTVITRRDEKDRAREKMHGWHLNLDGTDLREIHLKGAHLEGASFAGAHLEGAYFEGAHLEGASFVRAHLNAAYLWKANLKGASFALAHLERAEFAEAHLEGADFTAAYLEGTYFERAHLEGATFYRAHLEGALLDLAGPPVQTVDQDERASTRFRRRLRAIVAQIQNYATKLAR